MTGIEIIPTRFDSEREIVRGNFVKPIGEGPFPGICKFHGLPGSSDQIHGLAMSLANAGFLVLTFDFRGFRQSEGEFSLSGEIEDAKAAVAHLLESVWSRKDWVGVFGASFGGAIAICSAAQDKRIKSICVRAPVYDTERFADSNLAELVFHDTTHSVPDEMHGIRDIVKRRELMEQLKLDAIKHNPMKDIKHLSPRGVFITTGGADALIDIEGVKKLYRLAREPKQMVIVSRADHNLTDDDARRETERGVVDWFMHQAEIS